MRDWIKLVLSVWHGDNAGTWAVSDGDGKYVNVAFYLSPTDCLFKFTVPFPTTWDNVFSDEDMAWYLRPMVKEAWDRCNRSKGSGMLWIATH